MGAKWFTRNGARHKCTDTIQCYAGQNLWVSRSRRLIIGARKRDVESLTGFAEALKRLA